MKFHCRGLLQAFIKVINACFSYSCFPASRMTSHISSYNPHILVTRFEVSFTKNAVIKSASNTTRSELKRALLVALVLSSCTCEMLLRLLNLHFIGLSLNRKWSTEVKFKGLQLLPILQKFHCLDKLWPYVCFSNRMNVKFPLKQAVKAQRGSTRIALLFL